MENNNEHKKESHPEKTGKVPSSGVMSETYKEEVNPQDQLGSASDKNNEKERQDSTDSYPLEEGDVPGQNIKREFKKSEAVKDEGAAGSASESEQAK